MNKKTVTALKILTIIFFILMLLSFSSANDDKDNVFVKKIVLIQEDGCVNITEDFNYTLRLHPNIYRNIQLDDNQEISNISIETPGFYNNYNISNTSNGVQIHVSLYSDAEKTKPVVNQSANVIYHYKKTRAITMYNDVAEFKYDAWDMDSGVVRMTTYIQLPKNHENVEFWTNPSYYVSSNIWITHNTLQTRFRSIEANKTAQQILIIPKSQFNTTINANVVNIDAKNSIEDNQEKYEDNLNYNYMVTYITCVLSIILLLTPLGIYYKYNRQPKTSNNKIIQKIPYNDSPLFINNIIHGNGNYVTIDGFYATVVDLVDKKYIEFIDDTTFKINNKESHLLDYEIDILNFFINQKNKNQVIIDKIDEVSFNKFISKWMKKSYESIYRNKMDFFQNTSQKLYKIYSIITSIYVIGALYYVLSLQPDVPTINWAFRATIILIPVIILTAVLSYKVPRQWTNYGIKYYNNWKNFELYLTDYNLIKQYPPDMNQINKYIIYSIALGDIRTFNRNMELYFKYNTMENIEYGKYIKLYSILSSKFKNI